MAVTALQIGDQKIKFLTTPAQLITSEDGQSQKLFLTIELRICDEDFIPVGMSSMSVHEGDEESYHKALRIASKEKGHFVPEESTDYEWNPDYKPEEDDHEFQGDLYQ